jgi:hypothetical protein
VASIEDAAQIASELPGVTTGTSYGNQAWFVGKKAFAWQRPLSKTELRRLGDAPLPAGPILAVRVGGLPEKEVVLAKRTHGVCTIPHFAGYAEMLIPLDVVAVSALRRLIIDHGCLAGVRGPGGGCGFRRATREAAIAIRHHAGDSYWRSPARSAVDRFVFEGRRGVDPPNSADGTCLTPGPLAEGISITCGLKGCFLRT